MCHSIIREHSGNRKVLSIVITALTDKNTLTPREKNNNTSKSMHAAMFGFIAECFKQDMVNPADKSRRKTYERIYKYMEANFLTSGHDTVSNGCAIAMCSMIDHVFPEVLHQEG